MFLFAVPVAVREGVCGGGHERRRGRERDLCVCVNLQGEVGIGIGRGGIWPHGRTRLV